MAIVSGKRHLTHVIPTISAKWKLKTPANDADRHKNVQTAIVSSCSLTDQCYLAVNRSPAGVCCTVCVTLVECHCLGLSADVHEHVCSMDVGIKAPEGPPNTSCHQNKEATASIYLDSLCLRQAECRPQAPGLKWLRGFICTQKAPLRDWVTTRLESRTGSSLATLLVGFFMVWCSFQFQRYMKRTNDPWMRKNTVTCLHNFLCLTRVIRQITGFWLL